MSMAALICLLAQSVAPEWKAALDYDTASPIDLRETASFERDGVRVADVNYASPKGGRVTAYLVEPRIKGRAKSCPAMVFGHWGLGNRTEFLPEAKHYAKSGVVSLMINYPWTRAGDSRRALSNLSKAEEDLATYRQAIIDLRRAIDIVAARKDVDAKRIGYVGHSFGAQFGAVLSAIEPRIRGAVLMAGVPDLDAILLEGNDPGVVEARNIDPEQFKKYLDIVRPVQAIEYVKYSKVPLLFQFARWEIGFTEAAMKRYYDAAPQPKSVSWWDTGHELNDPAANEERGKWLGKLLGFKP